MYLYLLQRYLFQKYRSERVSNEKYSKILNSLENWKIVAQKRKGMDKIYKQYLTPFLKELHE